MDINYLGVGVATVVGMVLGSVWYSPAVLGKAWLQCIGKSEESLGSPVAPMIGAVVASLLTASGVALLFAIIGVDSVELALAVGGILAGLLGVRALLSGYLVCGWGGRCVLH